MNAELDALVEHLLALDDETFDAVVNDEVRGQIDGHYPTSPEERARLVLQSEALESDAVVQRWQLTLIQIRKSIKAQLGMRQHSYSAAKAGKTLAENEPETFARWHANVLRFRAAVEDRCDLAHKRMTELKLSRVNNPRDDLYSTRLLARLGRLEMGIRNHRDSFPGDDEPSEEDQILWNLIGD